MKRSDIFYMRHALGLAVRAFGRTSPNPLVGAVVVRNGRIIGQGYHQRAGAAHAEVCALRQAGERARGTVLYVTLEPCAHYGRTPPCVEQVIASGVKEVVIAMRDPNPLTNGRSIRLLRKHGIKVKVGTCEEQARKINAPFIKYITTGLPYVTLKVAQSLDGKIASRSRDAKWITCARSRALAHRRRSDFDAIMVGVGTVLADDPRLTARASQKQPVKVVLDSRLRTPVGARLFSGAGRVIILTCTHRRKAYPECATILRIRSLRARVDLKQALKRLANLGITNLICEGGATLNGALLDARLIDALQVYISPTIIGGKLALGSVLGEGVAKLTQAPRLENVAVRRVGDDFLIEGTLKYVHRNR